MSQQLLSPLSFIQIIRNRSTTEEFSPVYRRKNRNKSKVSLYLTQVNQKQEKMSLQQSIKKIEEYNSKINLTVESFDTIIKHRMQVHEKQLLSIMKSQVKNMLDQLKFIISNFNSMIDQKNTNQQIHDLRQQLQYYKINILKIFRQNKQLLKQNQRLKQIITVHQEEKYQNTQVLKKVTQKLMKEKRKLRQIHSQKKVFKGGSPITQIHRQQSLSYMTTLVPRERSITYLKTPQQYQLSTIPSQLLLQNNKNTVKRVLKPIGRVKLTDKNKKQKFKNSLSNILNFQSSVQQ